MAVEAFEWNPEEPGAEAKAIFQQGDILLDCLPGSRCTLRMAPKNAIK